MAIFEFHTRVSYDDVDDKMQLTLRGAMGMMQEAAIIHSDKIGYSVNDIEETHVIWMLVNWRVRMVDAAVWNENVAVRTWPRTMERVRSERDFEIVGSDGRVIAIGESVWVLVSTDTGRIVRIPEKAVDAYDLTERKAFAEPLTAHSYAVETLTYTGKVQKRDIDSNHHVNNRVYLDYAQESLPEGEDLSGFREVCVYYRKQMVLSEPVRCFRGGAGEHRVVNICGADAADLRAVVELRA